MRKRERARQREKKVGKFLMLGASATGCSTSTPSAEVDAILRGFNRLRSLISKGLYAPGQKTLPALSMSNLVC